MNCGTILNCQRNNDVSEFSFITCQMCNKQLKKTQVKFCSKKCSIIFINPNLDAVKVCVNCHTELNDDKSIFCSNDCDIDFTKKVCRCEHCDIPIKIGNRFCCKVCFRTATKKEATKKRTHCKTCNKPLSTQKIYCSYDCSRGSVDPTQEEIQKIAYELRMNREDVEEKEPCLIRSYYTTFRKGKFVGLESMD